jgi:hypothetical protein
MLAGGRQNGGAAVDMAFLKKSLFNAIDSSSGRQIGEGWANHDRYSSVAKWAAIWRGF